MAAFIFMCIVNLSQGHVPISSYQYDALENYRI